MATTTASENADQIRILGKELHDRVSELRHYFNRLGSSLRNAVNNFDNAARAVESEILHPARQLKNPDAAGSSKESATVAPLETTPRTLQIPEPDPTKVTGQATDIAPKPSPTA
jgi:DNA anti-recombination protein RmuC